MAPLNTSIVSFVGVLGKFGFYSQHFSIKKETGYIAMILASRHCVKSPRDVLQITRRGGGGGAENRRQFGVTSPTL